MNSRIIFPNEGQATIVHAMNVDPITEECAKQRLTDRQVGKQGLGKRVASIPVHLVLEAKNMGYDLSRKKDRDAWLSLGDNCKYKTYQERGRSGHIIIK